MMRAPIDKPITPEVAPAKAAPMRCPIPVIDLSRAIQARLGHPVPPGAN